MPRGIRPAFVLFATFLAFQLVETSAAQQIRFEDFSSIAGIQLNGSPHAAVWQGQHVLRMTDGALPHSNNPQQATAYYNVKQPLVGGFTTWFEFQMHNPTVCCTPGDGVAFIIQNSTATDPTYGASGAGLTALGAGNGGMGYAGINNNLAVEFDISQNAWDPNANHVAIQSCGPGTNTPVHLPGDYTIGSNNQVTSCLLNSGAINTTIPMMGGRCNGSNVCGNGPLHQVVIEYTPPPPHSNTGLLQIYLDPPFIQGTHTPTQNAVPVIQTNYNIATSLNLDPANGGSAWVGFTADQPADATAQDILGWEFTPHIPTLIQQVIPPGGTPANYNFGAHNMVVEYPQGFQNGQGILMSVLATPTNQTTFYQTRLLGTQFQDEACVIYLSTGGNCMVYSVTCQDPITMQNVTCPSEDEPTIDIDSSFYTTSPISPTNADFLEADPIGSNNWTSIFTSYTNDILDGTVSGKGKGFSDIVTTFHRNRP